jgi:hypothetical protein
VLQKHWVAIWNLETISSFPLGEKNADETFVEMEGVQEYPNTFLVF